MAQSGYTPILIYASGTASNVPLAANLTSSAAGAELALNYADGKLYFKNSSGVVTLLAGVNGTGIVAGSNTQIQFNNSGVFGASANLTWSGTVLSTTGLTATGAITLNTTTNNQSYTTTGAGTITISSGTAGSINNMNIGATTAAAGTFTTLSASSTVSGTGFSTYLASPPAIGGTAANTGAFTSITSTSASGILTRAAATQDGVELIGRAGGTTSLKVTFTPTTLTASRTLTLPDNSGTLLTTGAVVTVAQGGTGQTTYTDGQLLIGNTTGNTLTKATLTAGTGVTITNGAGAITINATGTGGTVTSVAQSFTGGLISVAGSPITTSGTLALTVAGTSGGVPYFSSASTWASSAALAASALMIGGGAGAAPSTTTTGTGVLTALGIAVGTAGAFVVNGGALGTPSSGTVTNLTGTASININGTVGATTPAAGTFTSLTDSGNLTFTGTGNRITGDFSNATLSSRVAFQTSTANSATVISAIPNGTSLSAQLQLFNNADPTNAGRLQLNVNSTEAQIFSSISGTGTYLPMTFYTVGSERMRLDTSGNVGIGTSSPSTYGKLAVSGNIYAGDTTSTSDGTITIGSNGAGSVAITRTGTGATNSAMTFSTTFSTLQERMRIDSSGNLLVGTTTAGAKLTVAGNAATPTSAVTFSATAMTLNCALSNVFTTTFTANVTTAPTLSNPADGQTLNWFITQDATGTRTMTWPTSFKWPGGTAGVLSTAANSVDLLVATYRSATGFWYATLSKGFA